MPKEKNFHQRTSMEERSKPYLRPPSDTDPVSVRNQAGSDCLEHKGLTAPGDSPSICNKSDQGNQMNPKQKEIFNYVKQWCQKSSQGNNPEPFYLFVSGGAGVGKSHLAKCIYKEASKSLQNGKSSHGTTVLLTAPTGMAALGVGGITLHSALWIPVGDTSEYVPLTGRSLETLQDKFSKLKLLIIDAISMVSREIMTYINERLQQIKQISSLNKKSLFGNVSILVLGDFYQLPPVKSASLMIPDKKKRIDLWHDYFKITILEEIVRQNDDALYALLLNRLRKKSKGASLSDQDKAALQNRTKVKCSSSSVLHIFTTNKMVNDHNKFMLNNYCDDIRTLLLHSLPLDLKNDHNEARDPPFTVYSLKLEHCLVIAVGARVMLIRNIDLSDGLAKGAFGTVVGFEQSDSQSEITAVYVNFDNTLMGRRQMSHNNGKVAIKRYEDILINENYKESQFPLKLAWACTIYKTHGISFEKCVIDLKGKFMTEKNYAALSRVTSLDGLFLRNFNPKGMGMNKDIHDNIEIMKRRSQATLTHVTSLAASANPSS